MRVECIHEMDVILQRYGVMRLGSLFDPSSAACWLVICRRFVVAAGTIWVRTGFDRGLQHWMVVKPTRRVFDFEVEKLCWVD